MWPELPLGTEAVPISNCLRDPNMGVSPKLLPVSSTYSSKAEATPSSSSLGASLRLAWPLTSLTFSFFILFIVVCLRKGFSV